MKLRIDLKIFIFLVLFYFTNQLKIYFIVMLFCLLHELGHIIMAIAMKMKIEKLEIMSLGFSATFSGECINETKLILKNIAIALAGPLLTLIFIIIFLNINIVFRKEIIYSNILILILNLLPIYPLDGGRVVNGIIQLRVGKEKASVMVDKVTYITIVLMTIASSIAVYYFKNIAIFLICIFLWVIVFRTRKLSC